MLISILALRRLHWQSHCFPESFSKPP